MRNHNISPLVRRTAAFGAILALMAAKGPESCNEKGAPSPNSGHSAPASTPKKVGGISVRSCTYTVEKPGNGTLYVYSSITTKSGQRFSGKDKAQSRQVEDKVRTAVVIDDGESVFNTDGGDDGLRVELGIGSGSAKIDEVYITDQDNDRLVSCAKR